MTGDESIEDSRDDRFAQWATSALWHAAGTAEIASTIESREKKLYGCDYRLSADCWGSMRSRVHPAPARSRCDAAQSTHDH